MVLLHGLGSGAGSWDSVAGQLAGTHRVYALDMRGHGSSDWPGTYSFELMRDDVAAFLDALSLDRVVLIGHSMGGVVGLLLAESHGDRLTGLILEDTPIPFARATPVPVRQRPDGPVPFDWPVIEAIIGQLNAPDPAWPDMIPRIAVPTLIIAGGPASSIPQDWLSQVAALIPGCVLTTIPVGHRIHQNAPVEFLTAVSAFLRT